MDMINTDIITRLLNFKTIDTNEISFKAKRISTINGQEQELKPN